MAQETTVFDSWLKEKLYRDLIFRTLIWAGLALFAEFVTLRNTSTTVLDYFAKQSSSISATANVVGTVALVLAVVAWAFKDLEHLDKDRWGQGSRLGRLGGVFRRLAGDLTLWTTGALITTLILAVSAAGTVKSKREAATVLLAYAFMAVMTVVVAATNIATRRASPLPWVGVFRNAGMAIAVYSAALIFLVVGMRFSG